MKQIKNLKDSMLELIKQPYPITMAIHSFTLHEERVLARVFEVLQPQINELRHVREDGTHIRYYTPAEVGETNLGDTWIKIPIKYLIPSSSKNHEEAKKALKKLRSRAITIYNRDDKGELQSETYTNVFMEADFSEKTKKAEIKISSKLMPQFLAQARFLTTGEAKDNYTKLSLSPIFKTSSRHVANIYKYISHFRDKRIVFCKLDSFKKYMNIENSYRTVSDIKRRVILPAVQELKDKADVWFDIAERVMDGRKFIGWKFNVYTRKPRKPKAKSTPIEQLSDAQLEAEIRARDEETKKLKHQKAKRQVAKMEQESIDELINFFKLSEKQAKKLIAYQYQNYEKRQAVGKLLFDVKNKQGVNNIGAYTVQVLKKQLGIDL